MNAKATLSVALSSLLIFSSVLQASPVHTVSLADLTAEVSAKNFKRGDNIREIRFLLDHAQAHPLSHLLPLDRVLAALPSLDDATLANLAQESRSVNDQIRAGILMQSEGKSKKSVLVACGRGEEFINGKCVPVGEKDPSSRVGTGKTADPKDAQRALEKLRREQEQERHEEQMRLERQRRQEAVRQAEERQRESARRVDEQQRQLDESIRQSQEQQEQTQSDIDRTSKEMGEAMAKGDDGSSAMWALLVPVVVVVIALSVLSEEDDL